MSILLYLGLGAVAGLIAGLFGVGGGLVIVPVLLWAFGLQGFDPTNMTHLAVGTSLATIIVTSLSSVQAHHRHGAVRWSVVRHLAGGLLLGSFVGAGIAGAMSAQLLQLVIGCFALWVAYRMLAGRQQVAEMPERLPSVPRQVGAGGVIGVASAIFGIGGGSLTVPYLSHYGVRMQQAVATSAACGLPIALAGAVGFMFFGQSAENLPAGAWGFVHVPAFLGISVASLLTAQYGAKLAHHLPAALLKRLFAVLLLLVGCAFIYKSGYLV
ncbi:MAG: sulfite exporter TauE/SafE family protein [Pseudomonadota bacterium]|nr:sulfite exporter TauE/SafE family protein [Pseudomonadota bacterium]